MSSLNKIILNSVEYGLAGSGGLTEDVKQALLQIAAKVAYIDADGQDYYDALEGALYPPAGLESISAVYTQSGTVYNTDTLDSLKSDLVVTAHYSDQTTETVTTYVLSGTLTVGTSTITVTYGGKTTTFNVTVSRLDNSIYSWDFTSSLVDSKQQAEAVIGSGVTQSANGLTFDGTADAYAYLANLSSYSSGQYTVELDVTEFVAGSILLSLATSNAMSTKNGIRWNGSKWRFNDTSNTWKDSETAATDSTVFDGKTLKFQCDYTNATWSVYANDTLVYSTTVYASANSRNYLGLGTSDSVVGGGFIGDGTIITGCRIYEGIV